MIRPVKLTRAENVVFSRPGQLAKRNGGVQLANLGTPTPFLGTLHSYDNGTNSSGATELVAAGGGQLQSWSPTQGKFVTKGTLRSPRVSTKGIYSDSAGQQNGDCCSAHGITLYAYEQLNSNGTVAGVAITVVDESTGAILVPFRLLDASGRLPQCVASGTNLFVFYVTTANGHPINTVKVNTAHPTTVGGVVTLVNLTGNTYFAVSADGAGGFVLAFNQNLGAGPTNFLVLQNVAANGAGVLALGASITTAATAASVKCLNVCVASGYAVLLWSQTTQFWALTAQLVTLAASAATAIGGAQAANVVNATAAQNTNQVSGAVSIAFFFEVAPASLAPNYNAVTRYGTITGRSDGAALAFNAPVDFLRSVGLASEAWTDLTPTGAGQALVTCTYDDATQPTYFVANFSGKVVSKELAELGTGLTPGHLANAVAVGPSVMAFALGARTRLVSQAGQVTFYTHGIRRVTLDFSAENYLGQQLAQTLHIGGGVVAAYDGNSVVEDGFHLYPPQPSVQGGAFTVQVPVLGADAKNAQTCSITPPADVTSYPPQSSASQIRDGSYILLFDSDTTGAAQCLCIYFAVNVGLGLPFVNPPAGMPGAAHFVQVGVQLDPQMNQAQVAQQIVGAVNGQQGIFTPTFVTTSLGASVQLKGIGTAGPWTSPVDDTTFGYDVSVVGGAAVKEVTRLICPAGKWIQGGEYFLLESASQPAPLTANPVIQFVFVRDDKPTEPTTPPTTPSNVTAIGTIHINSTDTATQVATKVYNAVTGYSDPGAPGTLWVAGVNYGPFAELKSNSNGVIATSQASTSAAAVRNVSVGGTIGAGTHLCCATYEWTDCQGQFHTSAPSVPFSAYLGDKSVVGVTGETSNGGNNNQQTLQSLLWSVATLRVTGKTKVQIGLFRAVAEESSGVGVYYRIATLQNDPTVDALTYLDTVADSSITSADQLYTNGGALENIGPPPAQVVVRHGNRIWLGDLDDSDLLWFSKKFAPGAAIAFSDLLTLRLDKSGGRVTALGSMDEHLVAFKLNRIFRFDGDGPDDAGANGGFSTPALVTSDVGCVSQDSVVLTDSGLMFQAPKGICLLTREFEVQYIGAAVEKYTQGGNAITSAVLLTDQSRVRFATDSGVTLVYDLIVNEWAIFTFGSEHGLYWNGLYHRVDDAGLVYEETPNTFVDPNGVPVAILAQTAWLKAADIQGFGRSYQLLVLAQYLSQHNVEIDVCVDYDETIVQTMNFGAAAVLAGTTYGAAGGTYGSDPYYGGPNPGGAVEQWESWLCDAASQFEAIRFTIREIPLDAGAGLVLQSLGLVYGVKGSFKRLPKNRSV